MTGAQQQRVPARLSVSLGLWLDRPADEVLATAEAAEAAGYPELWIGEMATYDAVGLATTIGHRTRDIDLTLGPLAVAVRTPAGMAMAAASVANLTGRRVGVALGTSSPVVVERWHGRSRARGATALRESAAVCRQLLAGERSHLDGEVVRSDGFRLRLAPPGGALSVAAFGAAAIRVAADHADRMVANLVAAEELADLRRHLDDAVTSRMQRLDPADASRPAPTLAVWVPTAVDPGEDAREQLRRAIVAYLAAPGYGQMFERAGFGDVVAMAREGAHPRELLAAVPIEMAETLGAVGSVDDVLARLDVYAAAGADEVVIVPSATDDDPAGAGTLQAIAARRDVRSARAAAPA
jgi:probable F420-dependent oxidoreductase